MVATLMQRLEDAGVLDNTVILIGNEGGMGSSHQIRNVPMLAGGANGAVQMGGQIVSPDRVARASDYPTQKKNGQFGWIPPRQAWIVDGPRFGRWPRETS
jgi:hypothetical protein